MYPQVMLHAVIIHAFTVFEQTLILLNHKEFETINNYYRFDDRYRAAEVVHL